MDGARILVAHELTSYRQALAEAFRKLRPNAEVFEAESECLDQEAERLGPDLVVCDTVSVRRFRSKPSTGSSSTPATKTARW